ncbi:hypothetical protein BALOs_1644 [Halobacteriovorax sp. BALOs_7]|uniref:Uncharacterized protein n=1 Tax=Halobacteriovorax vibrionivorans TaxID=2152716 RepID=A0ABY0IDQ5_9BACT|nr:MULTISPECIES: hypothetical protein [Halobacteriovorax]AYF44644.1 hypothetical protein BALOs_1644 [Halobacteriovorax sp. BALOs_7]RZF20730.1 hypothetical protein DAY19_12145 [Halobacteriovorax vibrionivorans]TGD48119.1 hypothetical protein EP118_04965 [Halobacteriovorax sp. Y22]
MKSSNSFLSLFVTVVTIVIGFNSFAQVPEVGTRESFLKLDNVDQEQYLHIVSREVEEVAPDYEAVYEGLVEKSGAASLGQVFMTIDKFIALGQKIWKIVEAGKPVSNSSFAKAISVIPNMDDPNSTFSSMSNWKMPIVRSFKVTYKNGFGSEVISFVYTVAFQYGGKYEGKGAYLTGLFVTASNISVSWGFNFNASSEVISIANQGSLDSPIASAMIKVNYKASSVLRSIDENDLFFVNGQGMLQRMR